MSWLAWRLDARTPPSPPHPLPHPGCAWTRVLQICSIAHCHATVQSICSQDTSLCQWPGPTVPLSHPCCTPLAPLWHTLLLSCCTPIAPLLRPRFTPIALLLHTCCTPIAPLSHPCCAPVALLLHPGCTPFAPLSHPSRTLLHPYCSSVTPLLHFCCTSIAPLLHPLLHPCCTPKSGWLTASGESLACRWQPARRGP